MRSASVALGASSTTIPFSGKTSPSARIAVEAFIGSVSSTSNGGSSGCGGVRPFELGNASISASSVSRTSATSASPIGARAASSGSLVITTSRAPSGSSGPGMFG